MAAKNNALNKPVNLSSDLEAVVGKGPMTRAEVTKKGSSHYNRPWMSSRLETRVFECQGSTVKYYKPGAAAPQATFESWSSYKATSYKLQATTDKVTKLQSYKASRRRRLSWSR